MNIVQVGNGPIQVDEFDQPPVSLGSGSGTQGAQGDQGAQGAQGAQGSQGNQGAQGAAGSSATANGTNLAATSDGVGLYSATSNGTLQLRRIQTGPNLSVIQNGSNVVLDLGSSVTLYHVENKQVSLAYGGTVSVDFLGFNAQSVALTGDVVFNSVNRAANRFAKIKITADSSQRNLTFPSWVFVGGTAPSNISANKTAILSIEAWGTNETDVVAAYAVQS